MTKSKIKFLEIPKWGGFLRGQWEINFAGHLSQEEKDKIYLDNFLWHLCSWVKVDCYKEQDAIEMFKKQEKNKCTIFYQFTDEAYLVENAANLTVRDLPYDENHMYYGDIYVMDWRGKWTFIMTHESHCGPYFIKND